MEPLWAGYARRHHVSNSSSSSPAASHTRTRTRTHKHAHTHTCTHTTLWTRQTTATSFARSNSFSHFFFFLFYLRWLLKLKMSTPRSALPAWAVCVSGCVCTPPLSHIWSLKRERTSPLNSPLHSKKLPSEWNYQSYFESFTLTPARRQSVPSGLLVPRWHQEEVGTLEPSCALSAFKHVIRLRLDAALLLYSWHHARCVDNALASKQNNADVHANDSGGK